MRMLNRDPFRNVRDFLTLLFWGVLGAGVLGIALFFSTAWFLAEGAKKERTELKEIFAKAISDGTVSGIKDGEFDVTSRDLGAFHTIWFTNPLGQRAGYFVSRTLHPGGVWEFKELVPESSPNRHVFYRQRLGKPATTPNAP